MAILSLLVSFIGKKLGDIVQAVFGWSVTALFGRFPSKKEIAVSVALLLAIAWPDIRRRAPWSSEDRDTAPATT